MGGFFYMLNMNYIVIKTISDLQKILEAPILINNNTLGINEEIQQNMWIVEVDYLFAKDINLADLMNFFSTLLATRQFQLGKEKTLSKTLFYLWFDEQAMQLRFNFISINNATLPFECQLNKVNSAAIILENYLMAIHRNNSEDDTIEFINQNFNVNDSEDDYILNLYEEIISPNQDDCKQ